MVKINKKKLSEELNNKFSTDIDWTKLKAGDLQKIYTLFLDNKRIAKLLLEDEAKTRISRRVEDAKSLVGELGIGSGLLERILK